MIIYNKKLGISSENVQNCNDLETLMEWRIGVAMTHHEICEKLTEVRSMKAKTGAHADRDWYSRTESARRLQEILLLEIELRIHKLTK